jgi:hypothetical protein
MSLHDFWPRMPCVNRCHFQLKRPHWSCPYCRLRRWFNGLLDPSIWHWNRYLNVVIPKDVKPDIIFLSECQTYLIWRDPHRRLFAAKEAAFRLLFGLIKRMETKPNKAYSKGFFFVRKSLCTLLETMAN